MNMNLQKACSFLKKYIVELAALAALFMILYRWDLSWFNTHMSRDFFRAWQWGRGNIDSWLGPELGSDYKRLPGPAYYILLAPFTYFSSLIPALFGKALLTVGLVYLLLTQIRRYYSGVTAVMAPLLLLSPFFIFTSRNFWNPSVVVALNCLQMYFLLRFCRSQQLKWLLSIFITFVFAVQIHFSSVYIFLSVILTVLISQQFSRRQRKVSVALLTAAAVYLGFWYWLNKVPQFDTQLKTFFGQPKSFSDRLEDLNTFVSLYVNRLGDYNLFSLFCRSLDRLGLFDQNFHFSLLTAYSWTMTAVFIYALFFSVRKYRQNRDPIFLFCFIHVIIFLIMLFFVAKDKSRVPYRYGLSLFPVQIFLIAAVLADTVDRLPRLNSLLRVFLPLAVSGYYVFFSLTMLNAQELIGRTHNTYEDNLEMTVKNKLRIYSETTVEPGRDPFSYLHGRTMNRFRLKEFDWYHRESYFSLYRVAKNDVPVFNKELASLSPVPGRLVALKNLDELKSDGSDSLKISPVSLDQLPQNLLISYYRPDGSLIEEVKWTNSSLVLPLLHRNASAEKGKIRLKFSVNANKGRYLNILMDSFDGFKWAYPTVFSSPAFVIDGKERLPDVKYNGNFLVQTQHIFDLGENGTEHSIEVSFTPGVAYNNADRIDIFTTDGVPPQEELFVYPGQNK